MDHKAIAESLRRYLATGVQPNPGPYGGEDRHYRIDPKYALPHLARDLDVDADTALAALRAFASASGGVERPIELDRNEVGRSRPTRGGYSVFEIPVAAIDE